MTPLAKLIARLTRGYIKETGREPIGIDKLRIKMEAAEQLRQANKVIQFPQQRSFKQEIEAMIDDGTIKMGKVEKMNDNVRTRQMFQKSNLNKTEDQIKAEIEANNKKGLESIREKQYQDAVKKEQAKADADPDYLPKLIDPEDFAKGGRAGFAGGSDMGTVADSKGKTGPTKGGYQGGGTGPVERPSGEGGNDNNNNNNNNPPPISTNNTTPDTTFFDKTSKSGLMSNISPSILKRLARIKKGITPILGEDVGLQYQNIDELNDIFTNFRITQDIQDLIKTKKLEPELKYRKEIGDNTLIEGGINQAGDASIMFKKQFADGGRANFVGGGMGRRGFLKMLAGLGGGIAAAKTGLLKFAGKEPAKQVAKELTSVPIGNPEGMPTWFKPLVNKIIKEGDDVTKKLSTKEREIIHTKKIDEVEEVTVYQDLNTGDVRLEYGPHLTDDTGKVIRASNEPTVIQLEYKASEVIEPDLTTGKGGGKTKEEFSAMEAEPEVVNWEGDIEMSGENVVNTVDDLVTDTSKLKKYATDNKLTLKEISDSINKQRYKNKLDSDPMEQVNYIEDKQGMNAMDYIDEGARVGDFDPKGYSNYETKGMNLPEKKADGGRIGFRVGGSGKKFIEKIFGKGSLDVMKSRDPELHKGMLEVVEMFRNRDKEGLKMYLQKFLPHMDDETIEAFIVGDAVDIAGQAKYGLDNIQGQLIRLGSGRDYKGKLEAMQRLENAKKLDTLDVTEEMIRKPNASGGIQTMLGE